MRPHTLGKQIAHLLGTKEFLNVPSWPPDVFAVAASILHCSGAYRRVIDVWPPGGRANPPQWAKGIRETGLKWRREWRGRAGRKSVPQEVRDWWGVVLRYRETDLSGISGQGKLCDALLQLLAVADEACVGFGIPERAVTIGSEDRAASHARELLVGDLVKGSSLCDRVHSSKLRVLPKLHTPQTGLTIRSLSHHLAFCPGNEIVPIWSAVPFFERQTDLNLLLLPVPSSLTASQFSMVQGHNLANLPGRYGLFTFAAQDSPITAWLKDVLAEAKKHTDRIDGLVLPELALTSRQFEEVRDVASQKGAFVISGLAEPAKHFGSPGRNFLRFEIPVESLLFKLPEQDKHHRWQLNGSQIRKYGLETQLDPDRLWWEYSQVKRRILNFAALYDWLTVSVLICEDLARPDPMGDLIRAVGPNLVIALLMDGPQLPQRWSGTYATVLADDPGCSVLTLTSLGMAKLDRTPKVQTGQEIALWKDAKSGQATSIILEESSAAVLLKLVLREEEEWSADGRSDGGATAYPVGNKSSCPVLLISDLSGL